MEAEMPEDKTTVAVLNLGEGVSQEVYERTLNLLRDEMEAYRIQCGWCPEFWYTAQQTVSPVFGYDRYTEQMTLYTDTKTTDADRATELRNIRGRLLVYAGNRVELDRLNETFRAVGFAEYPRVVTGTPWRISVPGISFTVNTEEDPTAEIQRNFVEFLAANGDTESAYHGGGAYARRASDNFRVPAADTVPLLERW
jgi:hypothetical protein